MNQRNASWGFVAACFAPALLGLVFLGAWRGFGREAAEGSAKGKTDDPMDEWIPAESRRQRENTMRAEEKTRESLPLQAIPTDKFVRFGRRLAHPHLPDDAPQAITRAEAREIFEAVKSASLGEVLELNERLRASADIAHETRFALVSGAFLAIAKDSPERVMNVVFSQDSLILSLSARENIASIIIDEWLEADMEKAVAWLKRTESTEKERFDSKFLRRLPIIIAGRNPAYAVALVARQKDLIRAPMLREMGQYAAKQAQGGALWNALSGEAGASLPEYFRSDAFEGMGQGSVERFSPNELDWLAGKDFSTATGLAFLKGLTKAGPHEKNKDWLNWVWERKDVPSAERVTRDWVAQMTLKNMAVTSDIVMGLDVGERRDAGLSSLIETLALHHPDKAMAWLGRVSDLNLKKQLELKIAPSSSPK